MYSWLLSWAIKLNIIRRFQYLGFCYLSVFSQSSKHFTTGWKCQAHGNCHTLSKQKKKKNLLDDCEVKGFHSFPLVVYGDQNLLELTVIVSPPTLSKFALFVYPRGCDAYMYTCAHWRVSKYRMFGQRHTWHAHSKHRHISSMHVCEHTFVVPNT